MSFGVFIDLGRVSDDEDCFPFFMELGEYLHDIVPGFAVERPSRFVSEDEERIGDDRSRDRDALLLSAGHLRWEGIDFVRESDLDERVYRHLFAEFRAHSLVDEREHNLFDGWCFWEEIVALEDESDILSSEERLFIIGRPRDIDPIEEIPPTGRIIEHPDDIHERGFPTPTLSHDGDEFSRIELEINSLEHFQILVPDMVDFFDSGHFYDIFWHFYLD